MAKENIVLLSRASFDVLKKDDQILDVLADYDVFYMFSLRSSHLPPKSAVKELHVIELKGNEEYIASLIELINNNNKLSYIVSTSEQDLLPSAYARERLGLPGLTVQQSEYFRDKVAMKNGLIGKVPFPDFIDTHEFNEIRNFFQTYKKIIMKPKRGTGSQDCYVIHNLEELEQVLHTVQGQQSGFFIEQFLDMPIYHFDALVRDGKMMFATIGRYDHPPLNYSDFDWLITTISNEPTELYLKTSEMLLKVIDSYGVRDGVFHMEVFADDQEVYFGEIAARPAGGGIPEAIYQTWGVHLFEEHVRLQLQLAARFESDKVFPVKYAGNMLYLPSRSGVVSNFDAAPLLSNPLVKSVTQHVENGQQVGQVRYSADTIFTAAIAADTPDELDAAIKHVKNNTFVIIS
ncbi:ATP-grasp domain-containing protein [Paenibacillus athensensis]|nr:ATP-grasp domain-containing protein [Paenibacillus athensensis]MCD1260553.1 ATP-grasp domain-containing protein [Paenibacillus athensensis]